MGIITEFALGVVAYVVLNFLILTIVDALTKTSAVLRLVAYLVVALAAALLLDRVAHLEFPIIILLATALWVSSAQADRIMDAPDFRERTGATVSKGGMLVSRVVLVAVLVAAHLALTMQLCSGPDNCRPLLI